MIGPTDNPAGSWPRLMRAETAARYVDEKSIAAFRRAVGKLYPRPRKVAGKGDRWLKDDLDRAIDRLASPAETIGISPTCYEARELAKIHD